MFLLSLKICSTSLNLPKVYFEFFPNFCYVKYQISKEILMAGRVKNGLYVFDDFTLLPSSKPQSISSSATSCESSTFSFHNDVSSSFQYKLESCNITKDSLVSLNYLDWWHRKLRHSSLKKVKSIMSNCNIYGPIKMEFPSTRIVVMEKFTNLLFLLLTLITLNLYNLYTLIYGVPLSFNPLMVLTTAFTLLMLT